MKRLATFLVVTFAWSWGWWLPLAYSGAITQPGNGWPTHLIGLAGPAIGAATATAIFDGRAGLRELWSRVTRWRVRLVWWIIIGATGFAWAWALISDPAGALRYSGAPQWGMLTVLLVVVLNGFGEEIGWRGYAVEVLSRRYSTVGTAILVWVVWGAWHLPLFWVVQNFMNLGVGGTVGWAVGLLCGSVFLTWMYTSAKRSILIVAVWHTVFNFGTATEATAGAPAAVLSTLVMVAAVVLVCLPPLWKRPTRPID